VANITDYGDNMARRVEMCNGWKTKDLPNKGVDSFNWKMSVDNPPVIDQLRPGTEDYYVAFYCAGRFDRDGAIAAARPVI
jgi:hypothetical protein